MTIAELAISVDFLGSIPGYKIDATRQKYTEIDFVGIETKIERSGRWCLYRCSCRC
ncbi:MAG: hypothetical protein IPK98_14535 [Chloracidobacterium sp.]|nr:hypothetical protein [Chloracidobacterium sp.]